MPNAVKLRKLLAALHRLGFEQIHQKGSHAFFAHADGRTTLVPLHPEIKIKLLTKIIKQDLRMDKDEFFKLLEQ
ncbi:MAG: type II toxin-antitoxin system HicA family toxin [Candidatus Diapherotrites archaeon]|nr:type II toxin-antitoxin system HicA family toxin [Candidatus Diapherotrites archaeon]